MLWIQTLASQGGFWIVIGVMSVMLLTAGYVFQRPPDGEVPNYRKRLSRAAQFWACVLIAMTVWLMFAHMIGSR